MLESENVCDISELGSDCDADMSNNLVAVGSAGSAGEVARPIPRISKQKSYDSVSSNGDDNDDIMALTDELRKKIIEKAEHHFSDENLSRDGFLLKHIKRSKEGYVNLKLVASFKKMRTLTRDYRIIGEALKSSDKLVVSANGLKIRRVEPLPKELQDHARVKNLVISNMPETNPSMDYVIGAFPGHKDDVISVRVVKPGKKFPTEFQSHFTRHSELKDQTVAVVEFDSPENAASAIKGVDKDKYKGIDVKLLELGPKQAKRMSQNYLSDNSESCASDTPVDSDHSGSGVVERKVKKKGGGGGGRLLEVNGKENRYSASYASSSDSDWSSFSSCNKRYSRGGYGGSNSPSPSTSPQGSYLMDMMENSSSSRSRSKSSAAIEIPRSPKQHPQKRIIKDNSPIRRMSPLATSDSPRCSPDSRSSHLSNSHEDRDGRLSPWMYQRMQLTKNNVNDSSCTQKHLEIIRQPRGPDGSFGFSAHPLKKYVLVNAY